MSAAASNLGLETCGDVDTSALEGSLERYVVLGAFALECDSEECGAVRAFALDRRRERRDGLCAVALESGLE